MKENHHSQPVSLGEVLSPRLENDIRHSLQAHRTKANKDFKNCCKNSNIINFLKQPSFSLSQQRKIYFILLTTAYKFKLWCNYKFTKVFFLSPAIQCDCPFLVQFRRITCPLLSFIFSKAAQNFSFLTASLRHVEKRIASN